MLIALIETEGVKWLEVLRRLACKDYGFIFVACITNVKAYPVLIKEAKNYASKYQIECLRGKIDEMMGNDHYNANLKWLIYSLFL